MRMLIRNHRFIMSRIARGTFEVVSNNFKASFIIEGYVVGVHGHFVQHIPVHLPPSPVQVQYSSLADFTGSYSTIPESPPSFIGTHTIEITFERPGVKNLTLTGTIPGGIDRRYTVTGSGIWSGTPKE